MKIKKYDPDYFLMPCLLLDDKNLSHSDIMVYCAIYFFSKMRGEKCYATNPTIGAMARVTSKTVGRSLLVLEANGYIERLYNNTNLSKGVKRDRVEIIPLLVVKKGEKITLKKKQEVPLNGGTSTEKRYPQMEVSVPPNGGITYPQMEVPQKPFKNKGPKNENLYESTVSQDENNSEVPPNGGVSNSNSNINRSNNINNITFSTSEKGQITHGLIIGDQESIGEGNTDTTQIQDGNSIYPADLTKVEKRVDLINEAIALFLPILPGDFVGKSTAFAKPPTRRAVKALLERYDIPKLKDLIKKYDAKKTDKYRPEVGTVYEFCTSKLAKIESYVQKEAGGAYYQKSISTPEHKEKSLSKLDKAMEQKKEKARQIKEKWELQNKN